MYFFHNKKKSLFQLIEVLDKKIHRRLKLSNYYDLYNLNRVLLSMKLNIILDSSLFQNNPSKLFCIEIRSKEEVSNILNYQYRDYYKNLYIFSYNDRYPDKHYTV